MKTQNEKSDFEETYLKMMRQKIAVELDGLDKIYLQGDTVGGMVNKKSIGIGLLDIFKSESRDQKINQILNGTN